MPQTAIFGGGQSLRCAKIAHGQIFLSGEMSCRGGDDGGRMVYITFLLATDHLRDLRDGGCAGADTPEEQDQYVKKT